MQDFTDLPLSLHLLLQVFVLCLLDPVNQLLLSDLTITVHINLVYNHTVKQGRMSAAAQGPDILSQCH